MNLTLKVWRQNGPTDKGQFKTYEARDISSDASFLEMLDIVNEGLESKGEEPIGFESDCREGICGVCGMVVNGAAHHSTPRATLCQVHMREFKDGDTVTLEPFRSKAFPVLKDLIVDRSAFDRVITAGGYISVRAGSAPDAHVTPIPKVLSDRSMDAAACIGCGACVAACPNAAAMLFTGAKVTHLNLLPQGQPERYKRVQAMVEQLEHEGFGHCSNHQECVRACPKGVPLDVISLMNRDFIGAQFKLRS
ncbi:MAG: succinate dehydrogenase/fumarate reductase iron-sulfur subunit [Deltaproteobacteria bacterium]|nr:succinate dehydrogenase/fumarate reductase iron-sulfur subunit [Deltaproteobacteria bacterium]